MVSLWEAAHRAQTRPGGGFDELKTFNYPLTAGQVLTNFYTSFLWEAANTNNPGAGVLNVWIDSPTNGTVLQ